MKTKQLALACAIALSAPIAAPAFAQTSAGDTTDTQTSTTSGPEASRLSTEFSTFAGSDTNAQALVSGLRDGTAITLDQTVTHADGTTSTTQTTIQPATGPLGYGNVRIALALAEASLARQGIADPTAEEIAAALNGGTLTLADGTAVDLNGVLADRAAGQGWGQIAKAMGFQLGELMRSPNATAHAAATAHGHADVRVAKVDLSAHGQASAHASMPDHAGAMARMDRPQRPVRPERPALPERPQLPDHPTHVGRPGG
ncbi:hypothetical protein ACO2Q2_14100 [Dyella sp. KRB-257]|uniref:hypothetical protein n=1 Tax=Dyella sp. KRB-257 TaxID=3400915 RepID=UPI003BFF79B7